MKPNLRISAKSVGEFGESDHPGKGLTADKIFLALVAALIEKTWASSSSQWVLSGSQWVLSGFMMRLVIIRMFFALIDSWFRRFRLRSRLTLGLAFQLNVVGVVEQAVEDASASVADFLVLCQWSKGIWLVITVEAL